ncbi:glycosyltransferase, partial [Vibrio parahaemolyticus]
TPERVDALRAQWGVAPGAAIILCPARLSPIKGQEVLIEAMTRLAATYPKAGAVIIGDDQGRAAYRARLEKLIANAGLETKVKLMPPCSD